MLLFFKSKNAGSINLNEHNLKAWVYGHWHINYMKKQGDVYSVCTSSLDKGGIDHSTTAFRVMHVDSKGDFTSELRYTVFGQEYLYRFACRSDGFGCSSGSCQCVFFRVTGERSASILVWPTENLC